jgi:hut operon positive regulator
MSIPGQFMRESTLSIGAAAMLLALTRTLRDEEAAKRLISEHGFKLVVTEVGGNSVLSEFQAKTSKAVLGAALNSGIMSKSSANCHALLHAVEEAKRGLMINVASSASVAVKIAIVRDAAWIAVGMFGESAIHPMTNHERAGLGVMHLGAGE